jgi:hypothetical protein
VPYPIVVAEGVAHGAVATTLTTSDALHDRWRAHFKKSKGEWLIPIISRMASGENVRADEAIELYKTLHQDEPASYEADF